MTKSAGIVVVSAIVVLAVIALWGWGGAGALLPYRAQAYHGDGIMTVGGFWSRPRYRISMPEVLLTKTQQHAYSLEGVPRADFSFGIQILSISAQGREVPPDHFDKVRENLSGVIAVTITDAQGETVYARSSPVQEWELAVSVDRTFLWLDGYSIPLKRGQRYHLELELAVQSVDEARVLVRPFLAGGGSELP